MKKYLKESWNNIYDKAEEFVNSALEAGASKKTAQSFFDDAWNKAEDNEDWIWESKKSNRKSIREEKTNLGYSFFSALFAGEDALIDATLNESVNISIPTGFDFSNKDGNYRWYSFTALNTKNNQIIEGEIYFNRKTLASTSAQLNCWNKDGVELGQPSYLEAGISIYEFGKILSKYFIDSTKTKIKETKDTLAGNNYKATYADQSNDIGYDYQYEKEQNWINAYPYDAFDCPLQFVGNLNKFLPSGVTAKIGDKIKATPYNGKGFKVEIEDDQSSDKLNKTFEIHFTYESDVDEIQVAAIFKPHRNANVIQTWITRDTTWEDLSEDLVSKIW